MSRIGLNPVSIPEGVSVNVNGSVVNVKGPKGELNQKFDSDFKIKIEDNVLTVSRPSEQKRHKSLHGLYRSLINNAVHGVSEGYEHKLELVGVGYKASNQGNLLNLSLGYSHNIYFQIPEELKVCHILILTVSETERVYVVHHPYNRLVFFYLFVLHRIFVLRFDIFVRIIVAYPLDLLNS